jgi:two-component system, LytTR family, response regulator LytT
MKVLILEDEPLSAQRASDMLRVYDPNIEVVAAIDSVEEATQWLRQNPEPDLMLVDIHLSDGLSFRIFDQIPLKSSVIFTTAYDQYAIQAFKVNSIDYLLKPLDTQELSLALGKYYTLSRERKQLESSDIMRISQAIQAFQKKYKNRFLVKFGDTIQFKQVDEVAYFFADDKLVYLVANDGRRYLIDYRIEQLADVLDPQYFFRINRKMIVRIAAIHKIKNLINSRLQLFLQPIFEQEIFISKEKSTAFKTWLDA